jgi:hypothetical protein
MAGNVLVIKHAESVPQRALAFARLFENAGGSAHLPGPTRSPLRNSAPDGDGRVVPAFNRAPTLPCACTDRGDVPAVAPENRLARGGRGGGEDRPHGQPAAEARRSWSRSACPDSTSVRICRATASRSATYGLVSE